MCTVRYKLGIFELILMMVEIEKRNSRKCDVFCVLLQIHYVYLLLT